MLLYKHKFRLAAESTLKNARNWGFPGPRVQSFGLAALSLSVMLSFGCAKKQTNVESPAATTPTTDTTSTTDTPTSASDPGGSRDSSAGATFTSGDTVTFTPVSQDEVQSYVGRLHPLNAPKDYKINVDLKDIGNGRFAGVIQFAYTDNGQYYIGKFNSGTGTNQVSYKNRTTGLSEAEYNQWFSWQSKDAFHGFFQDKYGAVIFVIDNVLGSGDGSSGNILAGSLWYRNFPILRAAQSSEKCWFLVDYAYECRTFLVDDVIQTTSALYPSNGYKKLGTFTGLNRSKAFNQ